MKMSLFHLHIQMIVWLGIEFYIEIIFPQNFEGYLQTSMRDVEEWLLERTTRKAVFSHDLGSHRVRK